MKDGTIELMGVWNGCFDDEWRLLGKITFKDGSVVIASSEFRWKLTYCPKTEVLQRWSYRVGQSGFEFLKGNLKDNILSLETHNVDDLSFIRPCQHNITLNFSDNSFEGRSVVIPEKTGSDEESTETGDMRGVITSINGKAIEP